MGWGRVIYRSGKQDGDRKNALGDTPQYNYDLTAFQVGYFTVSDRVRSSFVDWNWLALQRATAHGPFVRHIQLERGVTVKMNGRERRGVIVK